MWHLVFDVHADARKAHLAKMRTKLGEMGGDVEANPRMANVSGGGLGSRTVRRGRGDEGTARWPAETQFTFRHKCVESNWMGKIKAMYTVSEENWVAAVMPDRGERKTAVSRAKAGRVGRHKPASPTPKPVAHESDRAQEAPAHLCVDCEGDGQKTETHCE